jgi:LAO/AO transport system kinase
MKAGIMEIPDIAVVTKADMGAAARRALADLKGALGLAGGGFQCLMVSVTAGEGIGALAETIDARFAALAGGGLEARRQAQAEGWLRSSIMQAHGRTGAAAAAAALTLPAGAPPFGQARAILGKLHVTFGGP